MSIPDTPLLFVCWRQDTTTSSTYVCQMDKALVGDKSSFLVGHRLPPSTNMLNVRGWKRSFQLTVDEETSLKVISLKGDVLCSKIHVPSNVCVMQCVSVHLVTNGYDVHVKFDIFYYFLFLMSALLHISTSTRVLLSQPGYQGNSIRLWVLKYP